MFEWEQAYVKGTKKYSGKEYKLVEDRYNERKIKNQKQSKNLYQDLTEDKIDQISEECLRSGHIDELQSLTA